MEINVSFKTDIVFVEYILIINVIKIRWIVSGTWSVRLLITISDSFALQNKKQ